MKAYWQNGALKPGGTAAFSPLDRLRLGDGVFDTLLCRDGSPLHAGLHYARLLRGAAVLGFDTNALERRFNLEYWSESIGALLQENDFKSGRAVINTIITRGVAERGLSIPPQSEPQIVMTASPAPADASPIHAVIARSVCRNEGSPLSRIKSLQYGESILALKEAKERGANEALLLNNRDQPVCASAANIFALIGGEWLTPPVNDGAMEGITRARILEGSFAREASLSQSMLEAAQAVALTGSVGGVRPLTTLNGRALPALSLPVDKDFHL